MLVADHDVEGLTPEAYSPTARHSLKPGQTTRENRLMNKRLLSIFGDGATVALLAGGLVTASAAIPGTSSHVVGTDGSQANQ